MDIKLIKQVVDLMKRSDISEFEFEEDGFKLRLSSKGADGPQIIQAVPAGQTPAPFPVATPATGEADAIPVEEKGISIIKSPMVGTFYSAASPESPAFVKVGSKVSNDSVVCIIEAMKVMNEIKAEVKGTIAEVLVEDGKPV
ncbi:MAG: acetyl-CoA carboxylase biotin carboxyl carrier protein, partial [Verrucomicrobiota bacterium]|nr:acetyl-CoA carboxylase biotin carboxyl carrier protein [Verrucomicrobiota bacterium]